MMYLWEKPDWPAGTTYTRIAGTGPPAGENGSTRL